MTDITVILMFIMAIGVTVMLTGFGIAMFRSAQQAEKKADQARTKAAASGPAEPRPSWSPPRYDAAPAAAAAVSLRVGLSVVEPQGDALLVTWNAVNDGREPVMVQFSGPEVRLDHAGGVQLRYAYAPAVDGPCAPPETRVCAPGEIMSRALALPASTLGGSVRGLKLSLVVAYGAAGTYGAACGDPAAYHEWQQLAVSIPRSIPAL